MRGCIGLTLNVAAALLLAAPVAAQQAPALADLTAEIDQLVLAEQGEPTADTLPPPVPDPVSPDIFGSIAMPVRQTRMDERWRHVAEPDTSADIGSIIAPVLALSRLQQASFVQAAVNRTIAYREDIENWGTNDHWATASEALARRSGDCEDFAIIKMQALLRLGFDARDLYLVIGEDKARATHAILLVRLEDRFWVLDDRVGALVDATRVHGFKPTITLGAGMAWLYGTALAGRAPAAASR